MAFIRSRIVGLKAMRRKAKARSKKKPVTEAMHSVLAAGWEAGGEAFIRAAIRQLVLIETGMTAATFLPLAREVSRARGIAAVERLMNSKKKDNVASIPTFPSGASRGGFKSTREGIKLGRAAFLFRVGSPKRPVFVFAFETVAFQHAIHEPTQGSMDAGVAAFIRAVRVRVIRNTRLVVRAHLSGRNNAVLRLQHLPLED